MPILNMIGGGGSVLNFKMIAVASEDDLPSSAKENTIALIAPPVSIAGKPWISPNPPTGDDLFVGRVWINNSFFSQNIVQSDKNHFDYVSSLCIYDGSDFVNIKAWIVLNGAWNALELILFANAKDNIGITGGWGQPNYPYPGGTHTFYIQSGIIYVVISGASGIECYCAAAPVNAIDVTNFSTIEFTIDEVFSSDGSSSQVADIGLSSSRLYSSTMAAKRIITASGTYTIDISGLSGKMWAIVGVHTATTNRGLRVKIAKIRLY